MTSSLSMRKFLKKPLAKRDISWEQLYTKTILHIEREGLLNDKVVFLRQGANNKERTLRMLSIISDSDITREFSD
jgi:hypothetical protein